LIPEPIDSAAQAAIEYRQEGRTLRTTGDGMKIVTRGFLAAAAVTLVFSASCRESPVRSATVPFILDHNRMVVEAEFQRKDGGWRKARLWVDTGNPDFFIDESLALDLGIGIDAGKAEQEIPAPANVRIGGMPVDFGGVKSSVDFETKWLFNTIHNDGNLPSTVLKKYHVVFDYPNRRMTLAEPGILKPRGVRSEATIHPTTGIVQMDAVIDGEKYSLALDNGASGSFVPDTLLAELSKRHPEWPKSEGAVGCANIWGRWPGEGRWPMVRIPEILWGTSNFTDTVIVGLPPIFMGRTDIAARYSLKTAHPVQGFLGPNAFKTFRVEIVYPESVVYFEKGPEAGSPEMDIVRLTVGPLDDGRYSVIGVLGADGKPVVAGVEMGDVLLHVGDLETTGATMGTVIDSLRGKPGEVRILKLDRDGIPIAVEARVERIL